MIGGPDVVKVLALDDRRIQRQLGRDLRVERALDEVLWIVPRPNTKMEHSGSAKMPAAQLLEDVLYSGTGWFGNEATSTAFYAYAAILVMVPQYDRRFELPPSTPAGMSSSSQNLTPLNQRTHNCSHQ